MERLRGMVSSSLLELVFYTHTRSGFFAWKMRGDEDQQPNAQEMNHRTERPPNSAFPLWKTLAEAAYARRDALGGIITSGAIAAVSRG
jgi:hypothetical protein